VNCVHLPGSRRSPGAGRGYGLGGIRGRRSSTRCSRWRVVRPPLTTVRQPIESMGKAAVALLVNQIENVAVYLEELLFEPELVVRGSTGRRPGTR
jgi:hypothetical protein